MPLPTPHLSFPFGGLSGDGRLRWAEERQSVREVIWNILLTSPGERLMRPEFGAGLRDYIHQPNNETTRRLIADVAQRAIGKWEPRIELQAVQVQTLPGRPSEVELLVRYRLRATGASDALNLNLQLGGGG